MKVVILAGGYGTRISEESQLRPKPMIEVGGMPLIWHIMKIYSVYGLNDFVICCGYKGYLIKEYFANYLLHMSDVTINMSSGQVEVHQHKAEPWRVTLVDTGESTMTGGRLKRVRNYLDNEDFCCTYGDGVSDVNIAALIDFHKAKGKLMTLTAVRPPARFGALDIVGDQVKSFQEKPIGDNAWINGGFFVISPTALDYVVDDTTLWEREPMERLAQEHELNAFVHNGFWQPMDTLRDKTHLDALWASGAAPWKIWA